MFTIMNSILLLMLCTFLLEAKASSIRPRIMGGEPANPGQFPSAAAIYKTTSDGNYFCGGSLLSSQWILTAGQCVDGAILFTIILRTTNLQDNENAVRLATETYVLHPDYNSQTLENDLGLIKLRQPIVSDIYMRLIGLGIMEVGKGHSLISLGWGQTSDSESGLSNELHLVRLSSLSNEECRTYYGDQIKDNMLCAAGQYNEGTCYGDIGGAVVTPYKHVYHIAGVASFISSDGCESSYPSGYTRTFPYNNWIRNVTGIP